MISSLKSSVCILVITPFYAPDFGPSTPVFTAMCEDLVRMGYDLTVTTTFPHYGNANIVFKYPKKYYFEENINGVRVIRTYIYHVYKKAIWRRLLYHASINLFTAYAVLKAGRTDLVISDSPFIWTALPLLIKAIFTRKPYIYVVHDIYPDVLLKLNITHNRLVIGLVDWIEKFFYNHSIQISVLSNGFKKNLMDKGIPEEKISVIPICVDVDFVNPDVSKEELSREWGVEGKFVVLYSGNIGLSQALDNVVNAAMHLVKYTDIVFAIVGEGASKKDLENFIKKNGVTNVLLRSYLKPDRIPEVYSLADVSLVSLRSEIVDESVPSKTYTIMASGRPMIATVDSDSEVGRLINEAQCGLLVEPENPIALADAILKLYNSLESRSQLGKSGRDYAVLHHATIVAAKQYSEIIQNHLKKQNK